LPFVDWAPPGGGLNRRDFGVFTTTPGPLSYENGSQLSQPLAPLQSLTDTFLLARSPAALVFRSPLATPLTIQHLPRFRPLQRFSSPLELHDVGDIPLPSAQVAPVEFLTLPTPCSPNNLLGLFHPKSVPGVLPPRLCPFHVAVHALTCRCLRDVAQLPHDSSAHLQGVYTPQKIPLGFRGLVE